MLIKYPHNLCESVNRVNKTFGHETLHRVSIKLKFYRALLQFYRAYLGNHSRSLREP